MISNLIEGRSFTVFACRINSVIKKIASSDTPLRKISCVAVAALSVASTAESVSAEIPEIVTPNDITGHWQAGWQGRNANLRIDLKQANGIASVRIIATNWLDELPSSIHCEYVSRLDEKNHSTEVHLVKDGNGTCAEFAFPGFQLGKFTSYKATVKFDSDFLRLKDYGIGGNAKGLEDAAILPPVHRGPLPHEIDVDFAETDILGLRLGMSIEDVDATLSAKGFARVETQATESTSLSRLNSLRTGLPEQTEQSTSLTARWQRNEFDGAQGWKYRDNITVEIAEIFDGYSFTGAGKVRKIERLWFPDPEKQIHMATMEASLAKKYGQPVEIRYNPHWFYDHGALSSAVGEDHKCDPGYVAPEFTMDHFAQYAGCSHSVRAELRQDNVYLVSRAHFVMRDLDVERQEAWAASYLKLRDELDGKIKPFEDGGSPEL